MFVDEVHLSEQGENAVRQSLQKIDWKELLIIIVLVAKMKAKPGLETALAEGCKEMAKKVRENE